MAAIWVGAGSIVASTLYAPACATLTAASSILLYISYDMPTAAGILAHGKKRNKMGPFDLGGRKYKAIGVITIVGVLALIYAGVQPPNQAALPVTLGTIVLLFIAEHAGVKKKFLAPPLTLAAKASFAKEPKTKK